MGRGNNKFAAVNLNDIYGKKQQKSKPPPTRTENGNSTGGGMLVLTRHKEPYLVAKEEQGKTISASALKKESNDIPWAISSTINPFVACKEDGENERRKKAGNGKTESKSETVISLKPHPQSQSNVNGLGIYRPGSAAKSEGESRGIPRPSPPREVRNWDDDERSSILPPHQQNRGRYLDDGDDAYYSNSLSKQGNMKIDGWGTQDNGGDEQGREPWEPWDGYGMNGNAAQFHY